MVQGHIFVKTTKHENLQETTGRWLIAPYGDQHQALSWH